MNRKLIRNLTVFAALIAIAFIAKMEAINFLLALPIGIVVTIYGFKLQEKARQWAKERINPSLPWFISLAFIQVNADCLTSFEPKTPYY